MLILRDTPDGLREIAAVLRVDLFDRYGEGRFAAVDTPDSDISLAEAVIGSDSGLVGRTLSGAGFSEHFNVVVVGVMRSTEQILRDGRPIGDVPLAPGDVLLVQGENKRLEALKSEPHLLMLDSSLQLPRSPLAWRALLIMLVVIIAAATKILPIHVAAFFGVIAMLVTQCVKLEGIGSALSPAVVLLVASSIALGSTLVSTGAADWIATGVSFMVERATPSVQLAIFMAFSAILTNFVSNSAAAAVGTPIAVATAAQLGSPLEPFVLAILFGANLSFATPMAYQTNLLVMNAAGYKFGDFLACRPATGRTHAGNAIHSACTALRALISCAADGSTQDRGMARKSGKQAGKEWPTAENRGAQRRDTPGTAQEEHKRWRSARRIRTDQLSGSRRICTRQPDSGTRKPQEHVPVRPMAGPASHRMRNGRRTCQRPRLDQGGQGPGTCKSCCSQRLAGPARCETGPADSDLGGPPAFSTGRFNPGRAAAAPGGRYLSS